MNGATPVFSVRTFGRTDVGRLRQSNQDHFLIAEMGRAMWVQQSSLPQPDIQYGHHRAHLFLVADGMGGHRGGEVASALSVATVEAFFLNVLHRFSNLRTSEEDTVAAEVRLALEQAHARLLEETGRHPENKGMGTTFTMAFSSNDKLFVVHAGDSRCYLLRQGQLRQLTTDHTVVREMVERGLLTPEKAAHHAWRHVVTNVVGGTQDQVHVDIRKLDLEPNDVLLFCSDGLTDMLADKQIETILCREFDPCVACNTLVEQALEAGGRDNITAIVALFDPLALCPKEEHVAPCEAAPETVHD